MKRTKAIVVVMISALLATGFPPGDWVYADSGSPDLSDLSGMEDKIVVFDDDGTPADDDSLREALPEGDVNGEDYDGFIFKLKDEVPVPSAPEGPSDAMSAAVGSLDGDRLFRADSLDIIEDFTDADCVAYIEPDYTMEIYGDAKPAAAYTPPDDPHYVNENQWNIGMMNVAGAWREGLYGAPFFASNRRVRVAVIDSGFYGSGGSQASTPHEDVDYSHILPGVNFVDRSTGTPDTHGHGTFVAGMIAARTGNGLGIAGIMPEADILPLKVFGSQGSTSESTVISAIYEAIENDADVINMSLGSTGYTTSLKTACDTAVEAGILVVAAAGNDGKRVNNYPAAFENVVGVASLDKNGLPSYFSQYGESVFVAAPGEDVTSLGNSSVSSYRSGDGTSYASPEVAALAAMARSLQPDLDQAGFMALIEETSVDKGAPGFDEYYGHGLVDFGALAVKVLESVNLPFYHVNFDVRQDDGTVVKDAEITVTASEDIVWPAFPADGIPAGSIRKGTVIAPEPDGSYRLHRGAYSYVVEGPRHGTARGSFTTYAEKQTERVVLERSYRALLRVKDSDGDAIEGAAVSISRTGSSVLEYAKPEGGGVYAVLAPSGTWRFEVRAEGYETAAGLLEITGDGAEAGATLFTSGELSRVSFEFSDEETNQLLEAAVTVRDANGNITLSSGQDGAFELATGRSYTFHASAAGYDDIAGRFTPGNERQTVYRFEMERVENRISVRAVDEGGDALSGAVVTVRDNEKLQSPSRAGRDVFNLGKGSYTYTVSRSGYGDIGGSFEVASADRDIKVVMTLRKYAVSVRATGLDVPGISVSVRDAGGRLVNHVAAGDYRLSDGDYTYSVFKSGCNPTSGAFTVSGAAVSVVAVLTDKTASPPDTPYESGSGTEDDPYIITNETQLRNLAKSTDITYGGVASTRTKTAVTSAFRLEEDITLTSPWQPIGNYESRDNYCLFSGIFDGNGHTVSGLDVSLSRDYAGLFGAVGGAEIRNVTVQGKVLGYSYVGGVAGAVFYDADCGTSIENCANEAQVSGRNVVGGIVGAVTGGAVNARVNVEITGCANTGRIYARSSETNYNASNFDAGGIAGFVTASRITDCYNRANIDSGYRLGGIAGQSPVNAYLSNCYNTGTMNQRVKNIPSYIGQCGAIIGVTTGHLSDCYYRKDPEGTATAAIGVDYGAETKNIGGKSDSEMKTAKFVDLINLRNETNYGDYVRSADYPVLRWQVDDREVLYAEQPQFGSQPEGHADAPYSFGETAEPICASVAAVSDGGALTYQWYRSDRSDGSFPTAVTAGAIATDGVVSYTPSTGAIGLTYYYVVVTNTTESALSATASNRVRSDIVGIAVDSDVSATAPAITEIGFAEIRAAGASVRRDEAVGVRASAEAPDEGTLTWQWYRSTDTVSKGAPVSGATGPMAALDTSAPGEWYYYVKVTNTIKSATTGAIDSTFVKSDRIKLTVYPYSLSDEAVAGGVMSLIGAIGEVTTGSGARIADTRAAYDALTDVQKSLIASSFLEKLLAAEARYSELTKVGEDGEQEFPSQQDSPQDPPQVPQQDPAPLPPEIASNAPQRTNLQAADVTAADMVWTGRRISSGLKVKAVFREGDGYVTKALRPETDYVLSEAGPNRSIGKATVVVTGKGAYEGVKTLTFHIVPKAPTNVGLAVAKKSLKVKWTKPAKAKEQKLTGYQVRYRASGAKKWTVRTYELRYNAGERTVSRTIGKLKSRKTYEAQVRAYRKITSGASGGVYYSAWITARRGS